MAVLYEGGHVCSAKPCGRSVYSKDSPHALS